MRMVSFVFTLVLAASGIVFAQDWSEYQNIPDGFKIDFPGQPKISETTWTSEYGYKLPARVYSAERGKERYSMTVVDYNPIQQQGIERRKNCPAGAEPCIGSDLSGPGYWMHDIRGAVVYATSKFLERDVKMTRMLWAHQDLVEGIELQLTNNADQKVRCKLKYDASPQPLERKTVYIDPGKTEQSVLQAKRKWFSVDVDVDCELATKQS